MPAVEISQQPLFVVEVSDGIPVVDLGTGSGTIPPDLSVPPGVTFDGGWLFAGDCGLITDDPAALAFDCLLVTDTVLYIYDSGVITS